MFVAIVKLSLVIGDSHSLKEKRMVIRRIKDRARERLGVVVNEVGEHDTWQRAELGAAAVSGDRAKALEVIEDLVRLALAAGGAEIVGIARDVVRFDAAAEPYQPIDDRTGSGDKAQAGDDWVPESWRDEGTP